MAVNCPTALLEAAFAVVPDALVVHFSTDIVFGDRTDFEAPNYTDGGDTNIQKALDSAKPENVYGATKLAFEQRLFDCWPRTIIFRSSNIIGPPAPYLGDGKFERVKPHHSWNASQAVSNWFLINLQRHSDHHYRPRRRFPLLQHYGWNEAPQLPFGYATMIAIAIIPPLWFFVMDKRLERWREKFYPHINDWSDYDLGLNGRLSDPQTELVRA